MRKRAGAIVGKPRKTKPKEAGKRHETRGYATEIKNFKKYFRLTNRTSAPSTSVVERERKL